LRLQHCKYLIQADEVHKTDDTYPLTQLRQIVNSKDLRENTPAAHMNHLIKATGSTIMTNLYEIYYKRFSCYGTHNK